MRQISLPDGRSLDVVVDGDSGPAVFFHHGSPAAAESFPPLVAAARDAGLRWVSATRPGYGASTRRPGRSVADNCADVEAVLNELGVQSFIAMGWSGGGPHALACGALLAPRCVGVVTLGGVAPWDVAQREGFDWLAGMGPENHEEFGAALRGEADLRGFLDPLLPGLQQIEGPALAEALGGLVDDVDRAALTGEFADNLAAAFREAVRLGVDGWVDDDLAFARDWGFELSAVHAPVSLWQGADDRMVPYAHGSFLVDRLPNVRAHLLPGEGHVSIPLSRLADIYADVRDFLGAAATTPRTSRPSAG
ncbi:alpha/beta fold hydrolase [uncultured Jatrophihabitans sp.]|uniref:alpha/beta fold hydrolase n=1 Tax=uncultured Jatrophihabitans sp. TaxID=1610747 RepID=UPI0035C9B2A8